MDLKDYCIGLITVFIIVMTIWLFLIIRLGAVRGQEWDNRMEDEKDAKFRPDN